jgi:hypothetical protein
VNLDDLKRIRLSGKRPERIINLSLCRRSLLHEPVIEFSGPIKFNEIDFRPLHGLGVDIHYWNRKDDAIRLIETVSEIDPHSLYLVGHKNRICIMVYWKGQSIIDDQSFLYDWRHRPYAS